MKMRLTLKMSAGEYFPAFFLPCAFTCFCKSFIYHQPVGSILTLYIAFGSKLKFGFLFVL